MPHASDELAAREATPVAARSPAPLRALLGGVIDYAGLFPPASLAMPEAVARYAAYQASADAWALGRFVAPVARLAELAAAIATLPAPLPAPPVAPWRVAALLGEDPAADLAALPSAAIPPGVVVDVVELRAADASALAAVAAALPADIVCYAELALDDEVDTRVRGAGALGVRAKVRTGGVTAGAFPEAASLARFVVACVRSRVPFKATAGLHHPLRGDHPLTYEPGSARSTMYGFLNVLLAAAVAQQGGGEGEVAEALVATAPDELRVTDAGLSWRALRLTAADARALRESAFVSFGSCSFTEPIEGLVALGLL